MKDEIIDKIREYHPGNRPDKYQHYGWYVGGMRDTGDWYYEVMTKDKEENLAECLALLVESHKPSNSPPLSPEEQEKAHIDWYRKMELRMMGIL